MSIKERSNKIKGYIQTISKETQYNLFIAFLIILVGTASFGLGRLSVSQGLQKKPIQVLIPEGMEASALQGFEPNEVLTSSKQDIPEALYIPQPGGEVVASKSGSKYHFPWCAGAKQIAEKNLITFASIEDARKAGYTPASNCKGLK